MEVIEFEDKIAVNEQCYGGGGWFTQFNKARERREQHIEDLEALKTAQGRAVVLEQMTLYPWYCPSCQDTIYTKDSRERNYREHTIDCPYCSRPIYKAANYTQWQVEQGSKFSNTRPNG